MGFFASYFLDFFGCCWKPLGFFFWGGGGLIFAPMHAGKEMRHKNVTHAFH